jgi:hypothetical protein
LPKKYNVDGAAAVGLWLVLAAVADDFDRQLFYNGEGYLCMRRWPKNKATWTFDGEQLLNSPSVAYDMADTRNVVKVYGADGKGRPVLKATERLPVSHPFSPETLSRNGVARMLVLVDKTDNPRLTIAEAKKKAQRLLKAASSGSLSVEFETLPVPHLELGDRVKVESDTVHTIFTLTKFSLPLAVGSGMSVGFNKRVSWKQLRRMTG